MNRFPAASTVTPVEPDRPLAKVLIVVYPPVARISFTAVMPVESLVSVTKRLPLPSTATPTGSLNPLPSVITQALSTQPGGISFTALFP